MQRPPNLDKPLPLNSINSQRDTQAVRVLDKLEPLRCACFKNIRKPIDVTYELLPQNGITIHTHRNYLIKSHQN